MVDVMAEAILMNMAQDCPETTTINTDDSKSGGHPHTWHIPVHQHLSLSLYQPSSDSYTFYLNKRLSVRLTFFVLLTLSWEEYI
jgi:hypothetical protein